MIKSDRREFLGGCLAAAAARFSTESVSTGAPATSTVYARLGVRPLVNAAGILTNLGGSLMLPEVKQAMEEASRQYVNLIELHRAASARIAELAGVEAALVTSGAAAALLLGTAAAVTRGDPDRIHRLPDLAGLPNEVVVQTSHRHNFDHAIRAVGVRFVEVETREELERAIGPNTAMMHFLAYGDARGKISAAEWVDVAKRHNVPNFVDAAAEIPPAANLHRFCDVGFDLVAFSGGKALRGPQCSGLLLGRKDLVEAAFQNGSPNSDSIGRGCKVGKEEIAGLVAAVEAYVKRDHDADRRRWQSIVSAWDEGLRAVTGLTLRRIGPENAGDVPYLSLDWDAERKGFDHDEYVKRLREGDPRVEVWPTRDRGLCVTPFMLEPGQEVIVGRRLIEVFRSLS
jgi:L-seryl-tRNA(Ser) seleniumtransferase